VRCEQVDNLLSLIARLQDEMDRLKSVMGTKRRSRETAIHPRKDRLFQRKKLKTPRPSVSHKLQEKTCNAGDKKTKGRREWRQVCA